MVVQDGYPGQNTGLGVGFGFGFGVGLSVAGGGFVGPGLGL